MLKRCNSMLATELNAWTLPHGKLKRFEKVWLEPGESKQISFELRDKDFAYYDEDKGWTMIPGSYSIALGLSVRDLRTD